LSHHLFFQPFSLIHLQTIQPFCGKKFFSINSIDLLWKQVVMRHNKNENICGYKNVTQFELYPDLPWAAYSLKAKCHLGMISSWQKDLDPFVCPPLTFLNKVLSKVEYS
jgi:hypothetical protein